MRRGVERFFTSFSRGKECFGKSPVWSRGFHSYVDYSCLAVGVLIILGAMAGDKVTIDIHISSNDAVVARKTR